MTTEALPLARLRLDYDDQGALRGCAVLLDGVAIAQLPAVEASVSGAGNAPAVVRVGVSLGFGAEVAGAASTPPPVARQAPVVDPDDDTDVLASARIEGLTAEEYEAKYGQPMPDRLGTPPEAVCDNCGHEGSQHGDGGGAPHMCRVEGCGCAGWR